MCNAFPIDMSENDVRKIDFFLQNLAVEQSILIKD
jgi:hypothetical protein